VVEVVHAKGHSFDENLRCAHRSPSGSSCSATWESHQKTQRPCLFPAWKYHRFPNTTDNCLNQAPSGEQCSVGWGLHRVSPTRCRMPEWRGHVFDPHTGRCTRYVRPPLPGEELRRGGGVGTCPWTWKMHVNAPSHCRHTRQPKAKTFAYKEETLSEPQTP
jgi:hypothetical protein